MPSGEAASCSSWARVIPGSSFWHPGSAFFASAISTGVGEWVEVVVEVVWGVGALPPVEVVVCDAVEVVGGALLVVVVVVVVELEVGVGAAAGGALGVAGTVAAVEAVCDLAPPQPATATVVRMAMAALFIGPR
jgi:hypothetical protein